MTKERMIRKLSQLPHPIAEGLVVFDDGCEFFILTPQKGFSVFLVGRGFPIGGTFKLSPAQRADFLRMMSLRGDDSLEDAIVEHIHSEKRRDYLLGLLNKIGEDVVEEALSVNWPPEKSFYVFHDVGRERSPVIFPTFESAYEYLLEYFTDYSSFRHEGLPYYSDGEYPRSDSKSWDSMDDDELAEWYERLKHWRKRGSKKLPPRSWLGAYYSP